MKLERFPCVCGDVPLKFKVRCWSGGFSLRMRGCSGKTVDEQHKAVVFPAYAGMFPRTAAHRAAPRCFPRVCGDVPANGCTSGGTAMFSPRMRGCSGSGRLETRRGYVFPAYTGMFLSRPLHTYRHNCFPRIRGDVPVSVHSVRSSGSFSPAYAGTFQRQGLQ